jgi:hypothetical protein
MLDGEPRFNMSLRRATWLLLSLLGLAVTYARGDDRVWRGGGDRALRIGPRIGFSEGLGRISINGKWGFINEQGKVVVAPRFDNLWSFSEGMAPAMLGHKWGFINAAGKIVIPLESDVDSEFSEGVASVSVGGEYRYLDKTGHVAIHAKFESAGNFSEGWGFAQKRPVAQKIGSLPRKAVLAVVHRVG